MTSQMFIIVVIACVIAVVGVLLRRKFADVQTESREHSALEQSDQHDPLDMNIPLLSAVEQNCLQTLQQVAGAEYYVRNKLTLGEICPSAKKPMQLVDFCLFCKKDSSLSCVVQLQSPSGDHENGIVNTLEKAGVALYQLPRKSSYSILKMRETLQMHLKKPMPSSDEMISTISMQSFRPCPECQSQMNIKRSTSGSYKGALFWVCSAYPQCAGVELYTDQK